jgi:succinoglycan biosynthesis transport protein ExoP
MYQGADGRIAAEESPYSLQEIFWVIWKRLWIVVLVPLVCIGAAVGLSLTQMPMYEATAKLLVGQEPPKSEQQLPLVGNVEGLQQLAQTMVAVIPSRPVAEEVIEEEDLNVTPQAFLDNLTVEQLESTQVIELSYKSSNAQEAQRVVNAVSDVSSERISEVSAGSANIRVEVWEYAVVPGEAISPNPLRSAALALIMGVMLGVGLAFLLEHLDDSWRSPEDVERVAGVPTFGSIPEFEVTQTRKGKGSTT